MPVCLLRFLWVSLISPLISLSLVGLVFVLPVGISRAHASEPAALVILQYHHIDDDTPASTSTSPALFRQQLQLIQDTGIPVLPLDQALQQLENGTLGTRAIAITFDDAYISIHQVARPILREFGYPYTIFVNTDAVDQRLGRMLSWEQLRELAAEGVILANHSADHSHFLPAPGESETARDERIRDSLLKAEQRLQAEIGKAPKLFAYPYGEFDAGSAQILESMGYIAFGQHSGPAGQGMNRTSLPRFPASNAYGKLESLREKLLSLPFPASVAISHHTIPVQNPPTLQLDMMAMPRPEDLRCFASGSGQATVTWQGTQAQITASRPLTQRRERYNCTLHSASGKYFWISQPWFNPAIAER
ncbi:MAG: polysaccharide deacetylase [Gammaproteobacteria bacterium]|nr:MAG: polysaccharide deacetylase [Gammaproteobacteria bacterium]